MRMVKCRRLNGIEAWTGYFFCHDLEFELDQISVVTSIIIQNFNQI